MSDQQECDFIVQKQEEVTDATQICWNLSNEAKRKRFKIEVQPAAALNHTNIATFHTIEEVADELFIVMEDNEGQELRQIVGTKNSGTKTVAISNFCDLNTSPWT